MRPALEMFLTPVIGLTCFAILLVNWFGGVRYFRGVPAGLVALLARHGDGVGLERSST